jgi:hypothetical protein
LTGRRGLLTVVGGAVALGVLGGALPATQAAGTLLLAGNGQS